MMMHKLRTTCMSVALIATTALLSACGTSPQRLYVNPQVGEMGVVGHGQQVVVDVLDERPSERIGSRDGATNASSYLVVPTGDLTPSLRPRPSAPCAAWASCRYPPSRPTRAQQS